MTEEQKEKARADMERSVNRMRDKLVEVCTIAADALKDASEAETVGMKWGTYSAAVGKLRSMMRPEPGTLAWAMEIDWYVDHEPRLRWTSETGGGATYHTPPEALDAVLGNPPFDSATGTGALPSAVPLDPSAPKKDDAPARHMSNPEAAFILMGMAFARRNSVEDVTALQMGANRLMTRHFQRQRNWARRRAAKAAGNAGENNEQQQEEQQ